MKKLLFVVSVLMIISFSCSEKEKTITKVTDKDSLSQKTKIEEFLSKKSTLFIKDFYKMGSFKSNTNIYGELEFSAVVVYHPGSKTDSIKGMKVDILSREYMVYSSYDKSETVFLDLDELQELSDALYYMSKLIKKWNEIGREYTEVTFETIGNFRLVLFPRNKKIDGQDNLFLAVQAGYSKESCYFEGDLDYRIQLLKDVIDKSISKLKSKS